MVQGYKASIIQTMSNSKICPVAGLGPRRESTSWWNLRDRDVFVKAGANGKRLRDVLEKSLEQDPKRALQEIEKLWKKHGPNPPFIACKALALHRLDPASARVARACQELVDSIPVNADLDEFTFLCLIHYFVHETADYAGLHGFLQKVLPVKKTGIPFLEAILTQYMRNHNPKEVQKVALELCKVDPPNADKHYNMAVFSLIMQACDCPDAGKRKTMLSLAFRTLDKRFPRPIQESSVKMWCLFEMKDVALFTQYFTLVFEPEALCGEDAQKIVQYLLWYCQLLAAEGQELDKIDSIMAILPSAARINEAIDILARRHLYDMRTGLEDGLDTDEFVRSLSETINSALDALSAYFPFPGPRNMARLEYFRILLADPSPYLDFASPELLEAAIKIVKMKATIWIRDLLVECCTAWIKRPSLYRDLRQYLPLLSTATLQDFVDRIRIATALAGLNLYGPAESLLSVDWVIQHQNLLIIHYAFRHATANGHPVAADDDEDMDIIARLLAYRHYANETAPFASVDAPPDMVLLGDVYASLAVHRLFDLYKSTDNWEYISDAIVLLEALVKKPKPHNNPSFRVLLMHLYLRCGAIQLAFNHFCGLDIKSLQLNHIGHLLVPSSLVCSLPTQQPYVPDMLVRHFTHSIFEVYETQMSLIQQQEYYRLIDLEQFKRGMKYSSAAIMGQFVRLWHAPVYRFVTDVEARQWLGELDRYLGSVPVMWKMWRDETDQEFLPSWDVRFDGTRVERDAKREQEEKAWIGVMRCEMVAYQCCVTLASTYSRYNPMESRSLRDQLLDHVPLHQLDAVLDAPAQLNKALADYFEVCKQAMEAVNSSDQDLLLHVTTSFPLPLRHYIAQGCHGVLLRLCHLVLAVDKVVGCHVAQFDGMPAYPVAEVNHDDDASGDADSGVKTEMKLFGEALGTTELSFKLQQMIVERLGNFHETKAEDLGRFRSLLISLSLFTRVVCCIVWIIQCLKSSLVSLHGYNEARGKASNKSGDLKKLLDDWCGEFCAFVDLLADPLDNLNNKLDELLAAPVHVLGDRFAPHMRTRDPLGRFEPPEMTMEDVAKQIQERMAGSYRSSLEEVQGRVKESLATLRQCWRDVEETVQGKGKAKSKNTLTSKSSAS